MKLQLAVICTGLSFEGRPARPVRRMHAFPVEATLRKFAVTTVAADLRQAVHFRPMLPTPVQKNIWVHGMRVDGQPVRLWFDERPERFDMLDWGAFQLSGQRFEMDVEYVPFVANKRKKRAHSSTV